MKKNGFVLLESVVVLVVVALSLTMLISSYSLISRKTKEKEYYNRTSDKYLLYSISLLGSTEECNYSISSSCGEVDLEVTPSTCKANNKVNTLIPKCDEILSDFDIEYIYVVSNIKASLSQSNAVNRYDNGAIEYMKTLKKCNDDNTTGYVESSTSCALPITYMIGVFNRGGEYYYASIEL